jgi:hypothetical protein
MTGTLSRIPRGHNVVTSHLESLGIASDMGGGSGGVNTQGKRGKSDGITTQVMPLSNCARQFSPELVEALRKALQRGDLTVGELRAALLSVSLDHEDDIRRVLDHTIRLKRTIMALGTSALLLMKHVHPETASHLLRAWSSSVGSTDAINEHSQVA